MEKNLQKIILTKIWPKLKKGFVPHAFVIIALFFYFWFTLWLYTRVSDRQRLVMKYGSTSLNPLGGFASLPFQIKELQAGHVDPLRPAMVTVTLMSGGRVSSFS